MVEEFSASESAVGRTSYKLKVWIAISASLLAIANDAVAAGDGALST